MASIGEDAKGRYLRFSRPGYGRRKVRLCGWDEHAASNAKHHVEALIRSAKRGQPPPLGSIDWISRHATPGLQLALAGCRLIEDRRELGDALDAFILAHAKRVSTPRLELFERVADSLRDFLGRAIEVDSINAEALEEWRATIEGAPNTISSKTQVAKQFFRWLETEKVIAASPATVLSTTATAAADQHFVAAPDAKRILDRAIASDRLETAWTLALGRWGGLRFAEIMRTSTDDVDWSERALSIDDQKRKRRRRCPLFPELADVLPRDSRGPLFRELRGKSRRTVARRIEEVAVEVQVEPWPRTFHNLRATRETELMARFAPADVCAWIGNSPGVAAKHYALQRDEVFRAATNETEGRE